MGTLGRVIYTVGNWIRGSGQALDRIGSLLQGSHRLEEHLSRHRTLMSVFDILCYLRTNIYQLPFRLKAVEP
ncbi:unnamed protein product [Brassica rapa subsp. trilocularis]